MFSALIILATVGCAADPPRPDVASSKADWALGATAHGEAMIGGGDDRLIDDVRRLSADSAAVNHLGEPRYREIWVRFKTAPLDYLLVTVSLAKSLRHQDLSKVHFAEVVKRAADVDPEGARNAAMELLPIYRQAQKEASRSPWDNLEGERLGRQIHQLERIAAPDVVAPPARTTDAPIAQR